MSPVYSNPRELPLSALAPGVSLPLPTVTAPVYEKPPGSWKKQKVLYKEALENNNYHTLMMRR